MTTPTREQVVQWLLSACDMDTVTQNGRIVLTEDQLEEVLQLARADLEATIAEQAREIDEYHQVALNHIHANDELHQQLAESQAAVKYEADVANAYAEQLLESQAREAKLRG